MQPLGVKVRVMFTAKEFEIFTIPGFDARMPRIRAEITPKLKDLGALVAPRLEAEGGLPFHAQAAQHLRRTVNPPEETWVAFCREARGYKPYVHLRVAINAEGVKLTCWVEEDADDKPVFAANLRRKAKEIGDYLKEHPEIRSHHAEANYGRQLPGLQLNKKGLTELAGRLEKVRSQHVNFAVSIPRADLSLKSTTRFVDVCVERLVLLMPIYRLGLTG